MGENEHPTPPPDKADRKDLNLMEILSAIDLVTDEQVEVFQKTKVVPEWLDDFIKRGDDRRIFVAIDGLPDEQLARLKKATDEGDPLLSGIHRIRSFLNTMFLYTENPKYQLDKRA